MDIPEAVRTLERDLRDIFGHRLRSLVLLGSRSGTHGHPALAIVDSVGADDLAACAAHVDRWHDGGLATPIVLPTDEFSRSIDAFPLEFGDMLADHTVVAGANVFDGLRVDPADLRLACEQRARSHLLHLREGYLETRGRGDALADLIVRSAAPLTALVRSVARLQGAATGDAGASATHVESACRLPPGSLASIVALASGRSLSSADARQMFPPYLNAIDKLTNGIDRWGNST